MGITSAGLFYIFIYLPLYFLFSLLQRLYWLCNGMNEVINQIEAGQLYERSAQVFDIVWKVKKEPFQLLNRRNFIATHRSFEHPDYVLKENVSLLSVHLGMAIFVEVTPGTDIFNCRASPFIHLGQYEHCVKLITMPISSFVTLANELGDPKVSVIWLHSTGRCGSTALGQVFEVVPNCTTISEPMCLFTYRMEACETMSTKQYREFIKSDLYMNCMQAIVRMITKPNENRSEIIFIKNFTLSAANEVPDLERLFPSHKHLFLYRDSLPTIQSYLRSLSGHFWMSYIMQLRRTSCTRFLIRSPRLLINALSSPETIDSNQWMMDPDLQLSMTDFGLMVIQWGSYCSRYSDIYNSGKSKIRAIRYEDIIEHKDTMLTLLFKFCDIPLHFIEKAKKSLETDSQEGTVLSRSSLNKVKKVILTDELRNEANLYLKSFHLPLLGQPVYLPGILSSKSCVEDNQMTNGVLVNNTTNSVIKIPYISIEIQT